MTATLISSKTEVLHYTQSLCEALEVDYRLYTTKLHRHAIANNGIVDESYVGWHQEQLNKIREGTYDYRIKFEIEEGKKYLKVIMENLGSRSVHCFVDKNTGDVYKSASWKSPAKGVRYNLLNKESRENCYKNADWSGGYLYLR
jgi:hypothetical protein